MWSDEEGRVPGPVVELGHGVSHIVVGPQVPGAKVASRIRTVTVGKRVLPLVGRRDPGCVVFIRVVRVGYPGAQPAHVAAVVVGLDVFHDRPVHSNPSRNFGDLGIVIEGHCLPWAWTITLERGLQLLGALRLWGIS